MLNCMCSSNSCISSGERFAASAMCAMYLEQLFVLGAMFKIRLSSSYVTLLITQNWT